MRICFKETEKDSEACPLCGETSESLVSHDEEILSSGLSPDAECGGGGGDGILRQIVGIDELEE